MQLGQIQEAIDTYQMALLLNPQLVDAHSNLGNLYKAKGDLEGARLHYAYADASAYLRSYIAVPLRSMAEINRIRQRQRDATCRPFISNQSSRSRGVILLVYSRTKDRYTASITRSFVRLK
jgi:tetratricopeptide (TPR) repeat protein